MKKNRSFKFYKFNISDYKKLESLFLKIKFDIVVNLAAQAGVRYSIINPIEYIRTNILGFSNILDLSRIFRIKKLFYASQVQYMRKRKFPVNEKLNCFPKYLFFIKKK